MNDDPEITEAELEAMEAADKKRPFVDEETARAYSEYLKDWRWNMATHLAVQKQYMGRGHFRTENLF